MTHKEVTPGGDAPKFDVALVARRRAHILRFQHTREIAITRANHGRANLGVHRVVDAIRRRDVAHIGTGASRDTGQRFTLLDHCGGDVAAATQHRSHSTQHH